MTTIKKISRSNQNYEVDNKVQIRRDEDTNKIYIDFYAAVFNQRSKLIREWGEVFYEQIAPGAFDTVLRDKGLNTIHTVDHMRIKMLGRVASGTLQLTTDSYGLKGTIEMPDTQLGRDMVVMIERGDYYECSFIFTIADKGLEYDRSEDIPVRTVTNIQDLYDTAFVIDGAYANTNIKARFNTEYQAPENTPLPTPDENAQNEHDILSRGLKIKQLKTKK